MGKGDFDGKLCSDEFISKRPMYKGFTPNRNNGVSIKNVFYRFLFFVYSNYIIITLLFYINL